jgi:preprotein translocase subunit SecA
MTRGGTHIDLARESLAAGGLHVIAVERNESVRIDRQLIGRGARQGQSGSAQVFVTADDFLLEHYAPQLSEKIRKARADAHGEVSGKFSAQIDELQQAVERLRYEQRLGLAARDKWLDEIKSNLA